MSNKREEGEENPMSPTQLAATWFPANRNEFRIDEIAKKFICSTQHVWNLIKDGDIKVPAENIKKARSRAGILVPRESLVDFVARRTKVYP